MLHFFNVALADISLHPVGVVPDSTRSVQLSAHLKNESKYDCDFSHIVRSCVSDSTGTVTGQSRRLSVSSW